VIEEGALVAEHDDLVSVIASNILGRKSSFLEDARQEGRIALLAAIRTWSPDHGASLRTWAKAKIKWAVLQYARRERPLGYRSDEDKEWPINASLDAERNVGEDSETLHCVLSGDEPSPELDAIEREQLARIRRAWKSRTISAREREVLKELYGEVLKTRAAVGRQMGVSRRCIQLIEERAIGKLKRAERKAA